MLSSLISTIFALCALVINAFFASRVWDFASSSSISSSWLKSLWTLTRTVWTSWENLLIARFARFFEDIAFSNLTDFILYFTNFSKLRKVKS
ncbi:hypothetical protein MFC_01453 [Mesomycoplasma flocculare ATCC 27716]|nr:hypothetical protein MFC_01453 [Mesomycoplasma flocculare ATCC 27716]